MTQLQPTAADLDCAAEAVLNLCTGPAAELIAADILAGNQNMRDIVQNFARHAARAREDALREAAERIARG